MARRSVRGALAGRGFVLVPGCAYTVHQLRYELAYGPGANRALAAQGHGYLDSVAPWLALLLALGCGSLIARLARGLAETEHPRRARSFASLWCVASGALVGIYAAQEWLEGVFAAGHPGGLEGIFGHGGVWALPLAAAAGLLIASLLRVASAVVALACPPRVGFAQGPELAPGAPVSPAAPRRRPLAEHSAGRAPPILGRVALA